MTTALASQVRVYGVSPWIRILFRGLYGPMALGFVATLFIPGAREAGYFLAPFGVLLAVGVQWFLSRTRLELSPDGIRARNPGQTVETAGANVAGVRPGGGQPGIITRDPMEGKGAQRIAAYSGFAMNGMPMYDPETRAWMEARRFIPLKSFAWHLKHGDLVSEVERFAPQVRLQEALAAVSPPRPPSLTRKASTRAVWLVRSGVVLFAGGVASVMIFDPQRGRHLYALGLCFFFLFLAVRSFLSALNLFRKGAIPMGILFALLAGILLLSAVFPLTAVFS